MVMGAAASPGRVAWYTQLRVSRRKAIGMKGDANKRQQVDSVWWASLCVCMHVHMCAYMHTYTHVLTHTHIYTHTAQVLWKC